MKLFYFMFAPSVGPVSVTAVAENIAKYLNWHSALLHICTLTCKQHVKEIHSSRDLNSNISLI